MQLHHHAGLRVSRGRTRQYLTLFTRRALYAYPVSIAARPAPMPTTKWHGILMMTEILYVRSFSDVGLLFCHERLIVRGFPSSTAKKLLVSA